MKTYTAIVRDHSASMRSIVKGALNDYNLSLDGLKESEDATQSISLTVVECGVGATANVRVAEVNTPVKQARTLSSYGANGSGTPLWDSVGEAIAQLEQNTAYYDRADPSTAYLVMVITDGQENRSRIWNARSIAAKIRELQATDKWTFVFRVPRGDKAGLALMGIPEGNIMEWEQSDRGYAAATTQHTASTQAFFKGRAAGKSATNSFYADLGALTKEEVKAQMVDVSGRVNYAHVSPPQNGMMIRDFCNDVFGRYEIGKAYYELTKREEIQEKKGFLVREKSTGRVYTGPAARQMLGLPTYGMVKVKPEGSGDFELYVQSTSVNRKLVSGTKVAYMN